MNKLSISRVFYLTLIGFSLYMVYNFYIVHYIELFLSASHVSLLAPGIAKMDFSPQYLAGLSDAESTFTVSVSKDNRARKTSRRSSSDRKHIYSIHPSFAI